MFLRYLEHPPFVAISDPGSSPVRIVLLPGTTSAMTTIANALRESLSSGMELKVAALAQLAAHNAILV